ncbi:MAG: ComF family protein [Peptostreptococcus sp.]|uniref:ComF family protein n=1 Tax=Peptostreptococcus sp. TaxID=1262 RepID=UPI002FCC3E89
MYFCRRFFISFMKIIEKLIEKIYPKNLNCILCNMPISRKNKYSMCKSCFEKIIFIKNPCEKCGKAIINLSLDEEVYIEACPYCKDKNFLFDRNISILEYGKLSKKLVFYLKYSKKTYISKIMAEMMFDSLSESNKLKMLEEVDYIIYVPLSKKRFKQRGFNQSQKLAMYFSNMVGIDCVDMLIRNKDTKKLHKLNYKRRKKELKNVFSVDKKFINRIQDKNILLIDDIFTTGTTVDEISKILKLNGASNIISLTFLTGKYIKDIDINI